MEHQAGRPDRRADQSKGVRLAVLGTFFFSTSAVLVRLASSLAPLEVASYRLILGAGAVAALARLGRRAPAGTDGGSGDAAGPGRGSAAAAGPARPSAAVLGAALAAALHFGFYIASLYLTSIAHALVIVNLSPLLAMPLAAVFLGERPDPRRVPGVIIALAGLAVMVGLEPQARPGRLTGDALALAAALAYAVYSLIGRSQRRGLGLFAYTFRVYLLAGLLLLPAALWQRLAGAAAGGPPAPSALAAVVLLALLPTAGGHTLYNAALRRADTVTVNLIATQEVTGGVILGWLVLGERPTWQALVGGLLALFGLYLVLRRPPAGSADGAANPS